MTNMNHSSWNSALTCIYTPLKTRAQILVTVSNNGRLTVLWHYQGNIHSQSQTPALPGTTLHTDAYERINCDFTCLTILIQWNN